MKHIITGEAHWSIRLSDTIQQAKSGDVIVVFSDYAKDLGEASRSHLCPNKSLKFVISEVSQQKEADGYGSLLGNV